MHKQIVTAVLALVIQTSFSQNASWQQRVEYTMDVRLDVSSHRLTGKQKLTYHNNSPDTLRKVYYHLYFNAFQPGSMMDVRSRNLPDPDPRVEDRISKLKEDEIGYQHIQSLRQDGKQVAYTTIGTILEVTLKKPILPSSVAVFDMEFEAQVPVQIRRSGRDNREGIAYSMTQWYPKMAEYDDMGWHPDPYVAREFYGVWGDFDVNITLDHTFTVAGTGILQNADKIGHGYARKEPKETTGELTWHFIAKNVHDFAWAADPDYQHEIAEVPGGPVLHFFFQPGEKTTANWMRLKDFTVRHFQYMNEHFGRYPYDSYSVIQGGDGGMEYPMCTLITGERSVGSLMGVTAHEAAHSWFQGVLATNESLYPWMDEGFTDFAANESMAAILNEKDPHGPSYDAYFALVKSGMQEPASEHSDHYSTNRAYSIAAYGIGAIFLNQLRYVIGESNFDRGMLRYFGTWKFRHPEPRDFIHIMEQVSGMQLKWYLNYFISTTKTIDYGIRTIAEEDGSTFVTLLRVGEFPMPVDLLITYRDGSQEMLYIPTSETLGNKPVENQNILRTDLVAWPWVNPTYTARVNRKLGDIKSIEIDPSRRMADVNRKNNRIDLTDALKAYEDPTR